MKYLTRITAILTACFLIFGGTYGLYTAVICSRAYTIPALTNSDLNALDLSAANKLMIVAHPDDETLWGGSHLAQGGYLVVCITNGRNHVRSAEFQHVMDASGNTGLILSYPDKVAGKRDDWKHIEKQLSADLQLVLTFQPWTEIVTHNADGEYGHMHHRMTHRLVTEQYDNNGLTQPFYTFGKYYTASALSEATALVPMNEEQLAEKEQLLTIYASQKRTVKKLSHMNPYEMWEQIRGGSHAEV